MKNKQWEHYASKSNAMTIYFASDHAGALLRKNSVEPSLIFCYVPPENYSAFILVFLFSTRDFTVLLVAEVH